MERLSKDRSTPSPRIGDSPRHATPRGVERRPVSDDDTRPRRRYLRAVRMSIDAITGASGSVLHSTLNGLAERKRVIADNIANIQTPGFRAGQVDFETSMRAALTGGAGPDVSAAARSVTPTGLRSSAATRLDGNNVNLDDETMLDIETGLRYQQAIRALDDRFGLLRTSLRTA